MSADHDHHHAISRRNILILGGVAIVAGALPAVFHTFEPDNGALADNLMSLLAEPESAARLGTILMQSSATPREAETIAASIGIRLKSAGWHNEGTREDLREALAGRINQDYVKSDMVSLSGWQLARTAAELCTLAAVMVGKAAEPEASHD